MCFKNQARLIFMFAALAIIVVGIGIPSGVVVESKVDFIEVNHYFDEAGELIFEQVIFWDWCGEARQYRVIDWRFIKSGLYYPTRDWRRGGYSMVWIDNKHVCRVVRAGVYRETWLQHDPEVNDRVWVSPNSRKKLPPKHKYSPIQ